MPALRTWIAGLDPKQIRAFGRRAEKGERLAEARAQGELDLLEQAAQRLKAALYIADRVSRHRQCSVRGLSKVGMEALWACLTYNIRVWIRLRWRSPAAVALTA